MSESFDAFLRQAWADHGDDSEAVAERLRTRLPAPESAAQVAALARLTVHLFGEHLGRFEEARERLVVLAEHPCNDADTRSALRVGVATLNLSQVRPEPMTGFSAAEVLRAESSAASVCVGRGDSARGRAFIASARARLAALANAEPADHRPLAVACHNMAWVLIERGVARSADDTAAMVELARASREHWSHAGTWLEVERGDYDVARALLAAGSPEEALHHAEQCLAGCMANDAAPFEHLFAHEALARVHHALGHGEVWQRHVQAAQSAFERLEADDRASCRSTLESLQALA